MDARSIYIAVFLLTISVSMKPSTSDFNNDIDDILAGLTRITRLRWPRFVRRVKSSYIRFGKRSLPPKMNFLHKPVEWSANDYLTSLVKCSGPVQVCLKSFMAYG
ncbi:hypothetical protein AB6A40_000034 [Gnathostoma spinigerum]|uniref:Uncharacterized protein n=1 Tax=Gnathostoma spinigerum TaxID=75299 RepID=A0ABD6E196_9BILA